MGDSPELEWNFRIFDPITHKNSEFGMYYDKENKKLYIPSGLDLWKVRGYFGERYYKREESHPYKVFSKNVGIKYRPKDEQQEEALRFMAGVNEYEGNAYCSQLSVNLNTGKGKTYCSIATICFFKIKSIIITASNTLLSQWKDEFLKYTNFQDSDIYRISGSDSINMILMGKSSKAEEASIYLCSHGTLKSFGDTYGWDNVYRLFEYLGIGLKFFDEAHTNFENMLKIDYFTNVYKTYYVTATPGRSNFKENKIYQLSIKNVPSIDLFDENNDPHTDYIAIKWNSKPSPMIISACKNKYGIDRNKYIDWVTKTDTFYDMMRIIMELVIKCKGRVLMYIGTNDGILRVYYWICKNYPEFIGDIGIFTSLLPKDQKLKEKNKKILLSTTKSAGLGEHIQGLKMTIVLAEPFKSEIIARQTLGRTRDPKTVYIELVDMGFRYIQKFYFYKLPTFKKYASDVSDTVIDSYELQRRATNIRKERTKLQESPISMEDDRFDFSKVLPKKETDRKNMPVCPISFIEDTVDNVNPKLK
jgi:rRNA pseudouridine-1189 N-methylase Emg1 (Nep1/Mra1 family)